MAAGAARIRVNFQVDADGLLSVSAREATTGIESSIVVKPSYGLADDDIARLLRESIGAAEDDKLARALREQQVEAERLLAATNAALVSDGDLLNAGERRAIEALAEVLARTARGTDHHAVRAAIESLAAETDEFAARRMDRSIRAALSGRRIDEVLQETSPQPSGASR
jgi:molecular chaperone HscA